jgi:hypothetical protein
MAVLALVDHGATFGVDVGVGHASDPGVSCYYLVNGERIQVWLLRGGRRVVRLYRGVLQQRVPDQWRRFAEHLSDHPATVTLATDGKLPGISLETLGQPGVMDHLITGLDLLRDEHSPVPEEAG